MDLEKQELLKNIVPKLARKFGVGEREVWELLKNQKNYLNSLFLRRNKSKIRQRTNKWLKKYSSKFPEWNLGRYKDIYSSIKTSDPIYYQLVYLTWLTDILYSKQLRRLWNWEEELRKPQLTFWQCFLRCFKKLWRRR